MTELFSRFSHTIARYSGRSQTFVLALLLVLGWAVTGPMFGYSETWQLVINTATTIITFLMVFVLQNSQNRDGEAVQAKLDELIYAVKGADNRYVAAERLSDAELHAMRAKLLKQCEAADDELERREDKRKVRSSELA